MSAHISIEPGQWLVIVARHCSPLAAKAEKVREQTVWHSPSQWSSRQGRSSRHDVIFVGSEDAAMRLAHQLRTSVGNYLADCRALAERRRKRDEELIAAATAADKPLVPSEAA